VVVVGVDPVLINDLAGSCIGGEELILVTSMVVIEPGMSTTIFDT
jgi:hypothetical protein